MVALQAPINSNLGKSIGTFQAAFFSFATGTIILAVIAGLARGGYGQIAEVRTLAPQYLIGGVLGACYVSCVLVTVRTLGAGGIVAAYDRRPADDVGASSTSSGCSASTRIRSAR